MVGSGPGGLLYQYVVRGDRNSTLPRENRWRAAGLRSCHAFSCSGGLH